MKNNILVETFKEGLLVFILLLTLISSISSMFYNIDFYLINLMKNNALSFVNSNGLKIPLYLFFIFKSLFIISLFFTKKDKTLMLGLIVLSAIQLIESSGHITGLCNEFGLSSKPTTCIKEFLMNPYFSVLIIVSLTIALVMHAKDILIKNSFKEIKNESKY